MAEMNQYKAPLQTVKEWAEKQGWLCTFEDASHIMFLTGNPPSFVELKLRDGQIENYLIYPNTDESEIVNAINNLVRVQAGIWAELDKKLDDFRRVLTAIAHKNPPESLPGCNPDGTPIDDHPPGK